MNKVKVFYLVLKNSTSSEWKELPIDMVRSMTPTIDKNGNPGLLISYYDDEYCCNCSLACDGIDSIRTEEITY